MTSTPDTPAESKPAVLIKSWQTTGDDTDEVTVELAEFPDDPRLITELLDTLLERRPDAATTVRRRELSAFPGITLHTHPNASQTTTTNAFGAAQAATAAAGPDTQEGAHR